MTGVNLKTLSLAATLLFLLANMSCLQSLANNQTALAPVLPENPAPLSAASSPNEKTNQISMPRSKKKSHLGLVCSPDKIGLGNILTLTMTVPHGGYIEVITPGKEYILLSEFDADDLVKENQKAGATPFFAASAFAKLRELKINTAEATTIDVEKDKVNGRYQLKKIFAKPGKYKILLSLDSFEQDDSMIEGQCEIELVKPNV